MVSSLDRESSKPLGKLKDDRNDNCVAAMDVSNEMIFMGSDLMASEKVIRKKFYCHAF